MARVVNYLRPMRGSLAERDKLVFPYMASPKLDGVRFFVTKEGVFTKSGKKFRNKYIQQQFSEFPGIDGEFICGKHDEHVYRRTSGAVNRINGIPPGLTAHIFDMFEDQDTEQRSAMDRYAHVKAWFDQRPLSMGSAPGRYSAMKRLRWAGAWARCRQVPYILVQSIEELDQVESQYLAQGYEGVMLRGPNSPYKHGTSTVNENYLLKLKRFMDAEADIVDYVEFAHNENVAFTDAQGFTKRSSAKAGKKPGNKLGKFIVKAINGPHEGKTFEVGTGYTDAERKDFWARRESMKGQLLVYRCQEFGGGYDLPRIPTFQGLRNPDDMSVEGEEQPG